LSLKEFANFFLKDFLSKKAAFVLKKGGNGFFGAA